MVERFREDFSALPHAHPGNALLQAKRHSRNWVESAR